MQKQSNEPLNGQKYLVRHRSWTQSRTYTQQCAHAHQTSFPGPAKRCLKLSPRQGLKGHDLHAALEGRAKFMTQAWPQLAAGSLKGLELKFEMIEREGEKKNANWNVHWLQLGIVGAIWTWA